MTNTKPKIKKTKKPNQKSVEKYGQEVMDYGFAIVPSVLLHCQERLRINGQQLALLIHLLDAWWDHTSMPWPSKESLALRMGLSAKQIQRHMRDLETLGYVNRCSRYRQRGAQTSNAYDLSGLVNRLKELALELRHANEIAEKARSGARRPGLKRRNSVIGSGGGDDN